MDQSEQVKLRQEMEKEFRQNVAHTICQYLKNYLHAKKIASHVSYAES